jgi:hypothetical protein
MEAFYTFVTKAKRDTGAQHAGDGKFRHPRIDRSEKSVIHIDMSENSVIHV